MYKEAREEFVLRMDQKLYTIISQYLGHREYGNLHWPKPQVDSFGVDWTLQYELAGGANTRMIGIGYLFASEEWGECISPDKKGFLVNRYFSEQEAIEAWKKKIRAIPFARQHEIRWLGRNIRYQLLPTQLLEDAFSPSEINLLLEVSSIA